MQNIGHETVIFQVFIMEEIRKVKYKVGQKFMVEMREGYHLSKIVRREIEIELNRCAMAFEGCGAVFSLT